MAGRRRLELENAILLEKQRKLMSGDTPLSVSTPPPTTPTWTPQPLTPPPQPTSTPSDPGPSPLNPSESAAYISGRDAALEALTAHVDEMIKNSANVTVRR